MTGLSRTLRSLVPGFAAGTLLDCWRVIGRATSELRMMPDWLVVGAQRSGTGSLFEYIVSHPLVGRSALEEVHYFDRHYAQGIDWYRGHFPIRLRMNIAKLGRGGQASTGEATPNYLSHPLAPGRIARTLPHVRLLVLLRNPVDRAYSHFHHERDIGHEPFATFEEALRNEQARLEGEIERIMADDGYYSFAQQHFSYVLRGRYAGQLERIFSLFPRERVLVLCSEHLLNDPATVYARVLRFLGLSDHRPRYFPRKSVLHYPPLDSAIRSRLQAVFEAENELLFKLIGADFGWNDRGGGRA
jgi:hypothetical protein